MLVHQWMICSKGLFYFEKVITDNNYFEIFRIFATIICGY